VPRVSLPFQVIETINESRAMRPLVMFRAAVYDVLVLTTHQKNEALKN
jgi:hypothetical protein